MSNEHPITCTATLYRCELGQNAVTIWGTHFGLEVPPGEMLTLAEFLLSHRARLEQQQCELDQQYEALVEEIKAHCVIQGKLFRSLSFWETVDLMRELAGSTGPCDEWKPIEQLPPAGRWYRKVCCDELGGVYSHIWGPFYVVFQGHQQTGACEEPAGGNCTGYHEWSVF